jgi:hypothetical protein
MRTKLFRLAVVFTVLIGLGVVASPAQASLSSCTGATKVCLWAGINWTGSPNWSSTMPVGPGGCVNVGGSANNNAESIVNETPYTLSAYDSYSGVGYMFTLSPGSGASDLHTYPAGTANRISSLCRG